MAWYIVQECLRILIDSNPEKENNDFYSSLALPNDIRQIFERIKEGKVDR